MLRPDPAQKLPQDANAGPKDPVGTETLREKLAQLVYASGRVKAVALDLFSEGRAPHPRNADDLLRLVKNAQSKLAKVLSPAGDTHLDPDLILPLLRSLGQGASVDFAEWLLRELGLEADPDAKGRLRPAARYSRAEEIQARLLEVQAEQARLVRELVGAKAEIAESWSEANGHDAGDDDERVSRR